MEQAQAAAQQQPGLARPRALVQDRMQQQREQEGRPVEQDRQAARPPAQEVNLPQLMGRRVVVLALELQAEL